MECICLAPAMRFNSLSARLHSSVVLPALVLSCTHRGGFSVFTAASVGFMRRGGQLRSRRPELAHLLRARCGAGTRREFGSQFVLVFGRSRSCRPSSLVSPLGSSVLLSIAPLFIAPFHCRRPMSFLTSGSSSSQSLLFACVQVIRSQQRNQSNFLIDMDR
jgi:hypothetical protein